MGHVILGGAAMVWAVRAKSSKQSQHQKNAREGDGTPLSPLAQTTKDRPRIVILGGGFGGLYTARHLEKALAALPVRRNYFNFAHQLFPDAAAAF